MVKRHSTSLPAPPICTVTRRLDPVNDFAVQSNASVRCLLVIVRVESFLSWLKSVKVDTSLFTKVHEGRVSNTGGCAGLNCIRTSLEEYMVKEAWPQPTEEVIAAAAVTRRTLKRKIHSRMVTERVKKTIVYMYMYVCQPMRQTPPPPAATRRHGAPPRGCARRGKRGANGRTNPSQWHHGFLRR